MANLAVLSIDWPKAYASSKKHKVLCLTSHRFIFLRRPFVSGYTRLHPSFLKSVDGHGAGRAKRPFTRTITMHRA